MDPCSVIEPVEVYEIAISRLVAENFRPCSVVSTRMLLRIGRVFVGLWWLSCVFV